MGLDCSKILSPLSNPLDGFKIDNPAHLERLRASAMRPDVKFIVLDALSGATTEDENSSKMVHKVKELSSIAVESGKPFLVLHHLNKGLSDRDGVHQRQIRGSSGIIQEMRIVWAIDSPDESDPAHHRLSVITSNLGACPSAIGFRISENGIQFGSEVPRRHRPENAVDRAKEFLLAALQSGERRSTEVQDEAEGHGISRRSFFDARDALGVVKIKKADGWYMALPSRREPLQEPLGWPHAPNF
jgi:hypothetical protein